MKSDQEITFNVSSVMALKYSVKSKLIINSDVYVLDVDLSKDHDVTVAASLSNNTIELVSLSTLKSKCNIKTGIKEGISGVRFSANPAIIYCSSKDGYIYTWDTREHSVNPCLKYDSTGGKELKPLNTFDLDHNETFLIAGSDLVCQDSYLLFWDCRSTKLLGGYWESHTDDITQVAFKPGSKNMLASGSTDGLINIFDLTQKSEDDALTNTLNTESSVSKLNWMDSVLSCITTTEVAQLWDWNKVELTTSYDREDMGDCLGTPVELEYFINTFSMKDSVFLASGTHSGLCQIWDLSDTKPSLYTMLSGGHTDTLRCLKCLDGANIFVSGAEDGTLCVWKPSEDASEQFKEKSMVKQRMIQHSKKPY